MASTRSGLLIGALAGLVMALAAAALSPAQARNSAPGPTVHTLLHDGLTRRYLLHVPARVRTGAEPVPLVVVLHGGGGTAESAVRMTGFSRLATREGFLVAYPEGTSPGGRLYTWNAHHCCAFAMRTGVDDVGFIRALIETLLRDHPVDPDRVFVAGLSNGGMLAHRIGIEMSDRVAAIGTVIAGLFGDEATPRVPVSVLIINGALDRMVPPEGGLTDGPFVRAWDGRPMRPAAYQGAFWARANGCAPDPEPGPDRGPRVSSWRYACPPGVAVERILVHDNAHDWPGGQPWTQGEAPSTALDATETLWRFFERQRP
ncbi:alpha/beta hydrolase family esterase [Roseospira navarrensis]|uniref:Polyhydroxybutyrate depolymerase n=1 Tax=Roseospira navarrensis TaxID=140058 RepID=A0A7X1ZHV1_9PROT|nr:PHB depolymerase family esterase [Roseospira navarrensis]MQX38538.1 polyhydroxybutyrate depolymerase [Roseospira navarrensis]